jgi:hypothetical protein
VHRAEPLRDGLRAVCPNDIEKEASQCSLCLDPPWVSTVLLGLALLRFARSAVGQCGMSSLCKSMMLCKHARFTFYFTWCVLVCYFGLLDHGQAACFARTQDLRTLCPSSRRVGWQMCWENPSFCPRCWRRAPRSENLPRLSAKCWILWFFETSFSLTRATSWYARPFAENNIFYVNFAPWPGLDVDRLDSARLDSSRLYGVRLDGARLDYARRDGRCWLTVKTVLSTVALHRRDRI